MTSADIAFNQLCRFLDDPCTGWSLGTFGAIAEFSRDNNDQISSQQHKNAVEMVTPLGGIRINRHADIRLLPYESLSKLENAWSQGVVVCLPSAAAGMASNRVISDLGKDDDPLTGATGAKDERFFDLGLGVAHVDFCVRTNEPTLIDILEQKTGCNLLDGDGTVLMTIQNLSPTRVFRSRLGRIEVYQEIPPNKPDSRTPGGPHTHLMVDLLAHDRTHAANVPVPDGWLPCLAAYPPNPARTTDGDLRPFDRDAFERFQKLIRQFAPPELAHIKDQVFTAIETGAKPDSVKTPATRAERTALRVALRQCHHLYGPSKVLETWKAVYESTGRQ